MTESIMRTVVAADMEPPSSNFSNVRGTGQTSASVAENSEGRIRWLLSLILFCLLIAGGTWGLRWLFTTDQFAVARVRIEGDVRRTAPALLQNTLAKQISSNFFALNLDAVRNKLETLPWIAEARVRRIWPLTIEVWVREREALAHWGDNALVSPDGVVFTPDPQSIPAGLNYLQGPDGTIRQVIEHYNWLQKRLAAHELSVARLVLSDRHAWYVDLTSGLHLSLGNKGFEERMERFLHYLPRLPQPEALEQIDLRYTNGFAARWKALAVQQQH